MPRFEGQADDSLNRLWLHYFKSMYWFKTSLHMSARTKEAKTPSSLAKRLSGVSYSKIFPRFITITRSAVRIVWTRCCKWKKKKNTGTCYKFHEPKQWNRHVSLIIYLGVLGGTKTEAQPLFLSYLTYHYVHWFKYWWVWLGLGYVKLSEIIEEFQHFNGRVRRLILFVK